MILHQFLQVANLLKGPIAGRDPGLSHFGFARRGIRLQQTPIPRDYRGGATPHDHRERRSWDRLAETPLLNDWMDSFIVASTGVTAVYDDVNATYTISVDFDGASPLTTQGDMMYHDGTDNVRLAKGTANQILAMNSGATAPEWSSILDEDDMSSDSATDVASQQSIKAYVDTNGYVEPTEVDNGNSGTAKTLDLSSANFHKLTLTGNVTLTLTAPSEPAVVRILFVQDGTGGRTVSWPGTVKHPGGTYTQPDATASAKSLNLLYYDGTDYYCESANMQHLQ